MAARLAARGYIGNPDALDGQWGFMSVTAGGFTAKKTQQGFGNDWSIVEPGVSIKPYPCGIVTHQSMDAMTTIIRRNNVKHQDIARIDFFAGSNILDPIRFSKAKDHLQAKFCMPALLAMIAITGKAGRDEFSDDFIRSPDFQSLQEKVYLHKDAAYEADGFDRIRSRIKVTLKDGSELVECSPNAYRGGPDNPMSDTDLERKFQDCVSGILNESDATQIVEIVNKLDRIDDASQLFRLIRTKQLLKWADG